MNELIDLIGGIGLEIQPERGCQRHKYETGLFNIHRSALSWYMDLRC